MHVTPCFVYAVVVVLTWGIVGLLQKLSTNEISAESSSIWIVAGFFLLTPIFYPGRSLFKYPARSLLYVLSSALLCAVGSWALLVAMKKGGKASIICPFTALYPLVVVLAAPIVLHESITLVQGAGVLCALTAVALLST